jgi:uracil-DNA glycosylase
MSHQSLADSSRLMDEMGIGPLWVRRYVAQTVAEGADDLNPAMTVEMVPVAAVPAAADHAQTPEVSTPTRVPTPSVRPQPIQSDDGLPPWLTEMDDADTLPAGFIPDDDDDDDGPVIRINPAIAGMDWGKLKETVAACEQCGLCRGRKNTVFGVGDEKAKWLFIGEGPGRNEDMQGQPFIGPAGKLLDNMLLAMGLKRGDNAYIANIVKCRPVDGSGKDRPPSAQEVAACLPYLQRQIALIQPTVLVALGKTAALSLLAMDPATPVSKLRGTVHRYQGLPLVVTYHPAYLLRQLGDKSKTWSDLCLAMSAYANAPS